MSFHFNLAVNLPGTAQGPVVKTLRSAIAKHVGEDGVGLTSKEQTELAVRRFLRSLYDRELQQVDVAEATAAKRVEMDEARDVIELGGQEIIVIERALHDKADDDWTEE